MTFKEFEEVLTREERHKIESEVVANMFPHLPEKLDSGGNDDETNR